MRRTLLLTLSLVLLSPTLASSHGGGLDSDGGHWNHRTGEYHYHRRRAPRPAPRPKATRPEPRPTPATQPAPPPKRTTPEPTPRPLLDITMKPTVVLDFSTPAPRATSPATPRTRAPSPPPPPSPAAAAPSRLLPAASSFAAPPITEHDVASGTITKPETATPPPAPVFAVGGAREFHHYRDCRRLFAPTVRTLLESDAAREGLRPCRVCVRRKDGAERR
ncbi:MAG: YHYH domain-containing protein [Acidobacteriota bacterium]